MRRGSLPDFFDGCVLLESFAEVLRSFGCNLILDKPKKKALHISPAHKLFYSTCTAWAQLDVKEQSCQFATGRQLWFPSLRSAHSACQMPADALSEAELSVNRFLLSLPVAAFWRYWADTADTFLLRTLYCWYEIAMLGALWHRHAAQCNVSAAVHEEIKLFPSPFYLQGDGHQNFCCFYKRPQVSVPSGSQYFPKGMDYN